MEKQYWVVARWHGVRRLTGPEAEVHYFGPFATEAAAYEERDFLIECYSHLCREGECAFYVAEKPAGWAPAGARAAEALVAL